MRAMPLRWRAAVTLPLVLVAFGCSKNPTSPSPIRVVTPIAGPAAALPAGSSATSVYLHGIGANANPATLTLDALAPTATTEKYKDSPAVKFAGGNAWVEVGTWIASPKLTNGTLSALGDLQLWLGLKNSDDVGTNFDVRAEVYKNGVLVASGESDCVSGLSRNPAMAKPVGVAFDPFKPVTFDGGKEVLSLKLLTRIGTNGSGGACGGHSSASGLRAYFDATSRAAEFDASFGDGTATVDVTVVDAKTKAPIPGAFVSLKYQAALPKGKKPPGVMSGSTDGNGQIEFIDQPVKIPVVIVVNVNDGSGRSAKVDLPGGFAEGPNSVLVAVPPSATGSLSGVVTDAATGRPLAGVEIILNPVSGGSSIPGGLTAADGSYAASGLQPGSYDVTFLLSGYQGFRAHGVAVVAGSNTVQNAQLTALPPPAAAVTVTVIEENTQLPIPKTTVSLNYKVVPPSGDQHPFGITDGTGTITFDSQSSQIEVDIVATLNDGSGRVATINVPGGLTAGMNTYVMGMPPAITGSVSGVVTDASTSGALAGVQVSVVDANNNTVANTVTGADGSYSIGSIFVGTKSMTFSLTGYQVGTASGVAVSANANTVVNEELQPVPNPSNANVDVTVIDSQTGAGFAGAEVTITYTTGGLPAIAQTDSNGLVNFSNQLVGVIATISVNDPNSGRSASMPVPAGFLPGTNPPITIQL